MKTIKFSGIFYVLLIPIALLFSNYLNAGPSRQPSYFVTNQISDDTEILNNLIQKASGLNDPIKLEARVYEIGELKIDRPVKLMGVQNKTILRPKSKDVRTLLITNSSIEIVGLTFDGADIAAGAISGSSNIVLDNVTIRNLKGTEKMAAVGVRHFSDEAEPVLSISNSTFTNIYGFEDGKGGNFIGAHRGVSSKGGRVTIENSIFANIQGTEDGDCIHIITSQDSEGEWKSRGKIDINNCRFIDFGKRGIKLQASNAKVENCFFDRHTSGKKKGYAAVSVYGNDCFVVNNIIKVSNCFSAITVTSGTRNHIDSNKIEIDRFFRNGLTWPVVINSKGDNQLKKNNFSIYNKRDFMYSSTISKENVSKLRTANSIKRLSN